MYGVSQLSKIDGEYIPLGGAEVDVFLSIEHLDEDQWFSGGNVLDLINTQVRSESRERPKNAYVVAVSNRKHCSVAGLKVESPRGGAASKRGGPAMSGNDVKPF